jgi:alpha-N-arabinofuranosidase
MTGMERNSDLIVMASYAPLLTDVNPEALQWTPDLIGYDALMSYGSPSYYAQVLFNSYLGTEIVPGTLTGGNPRLFYSATRDAQHGVIFLKIVNASSQPQPVNIKLSGATHILPTAKSAVLSALTPAQTNTLLDPKRIVPVHGEVTGVKGEFRRTFAPYSITVLELSAH